MIDVHAAHTFMHRNARAIDRACAQAMFDASCVGTARAHILAYRNDDGGFGQCLEPDLRTPHSQPLHTEVALYMLRDLATPEPDIANAAAQWLGTVADGVHTSAYLPGALDYPAAPHWQSGFGRNAQHGPDTSVAAGPGLALVR